MRLSTRKVTAGYESGFAVRNISMEVPSGDILGIIGPNGAGKTTLLRALTRTLPLRNGSVLLDDRDIRDMSVKELAKQVAVVSQTIPSGLMSVEEFVLLGRLPHYSRFQFLENRTDREHAEWAMTVTDSLRLETRAMDELSGGERQLVLVARALAQQPRLLLLDEPIAHLDIGHQVHVLDLLRRLNREIGFTIIMVLHDLNLAAEYCHRLALLDNGRLHTVGTPEEVINYRTIEEVYNTVVLVDKSPVSSKPYVLAVPEEERNRA